MPVNFQQIREQIQQKLTQLESRTQEKQDLLEKALNLLEEYSQKQNDLRELLNQVSQMASNLRCAEPSDEALNGSFDEQSAPEHWILLAADGSQIAPDPHRAVEFGVINTGLFAFQTGASPLERVKSEMLLFDELYPNHVPLGEEMLALQRDLRERGLLLTQALEFRQKECPLITLTDGPLELYRQPQQDDTLQKAFEDYLSVLSQMKKEGIITAGYVDRPRSDYVVSLLELVILREAQSLRDAGKKRPLWGVRDVDLFSRILAPGARSALFGIHSLSAKRFSMDDEDLALCFFYLNVGKQENPYIVRVEIPRFVAKNADRVALVQSILLDQCRQLSAHPYPYALHRAHEIAVVHYDERQMLENMLAMEIRRRGAEPGQVSHKQSHKDNISRR